MNGKKILSTLFFQVWVQSGRVSTKWPWHEGGVVREEIKGRVEEGAIGKFIDMRLVGGVAEALPFNFPSWKVY